jgi:hypothetical protein
MAAELWRGGLATQVQELISANGASYIRQVSHGAGLLQRGAPLMLRRPAGAASAASLKALQERWQAGYGYDAKVANREIRVRRGATEKGP